MQIELALSAKLIQKDWNTYKRAEAHEATVDSRSQLLQRS